MLEHWPQNPWNPKNPSESVVYFTTSNQFLMLVPLGSFSR
jgi:hypothetical protein